MTACRHSGRTPSSLVRFLATLPSPPWWTRQPKMTASGAKFESPGAPSLAACGRFTNLLKTMSGRDWSFFDEAKRVSDCLLIAGAVFPIGMATQREIKPRDHANILPCRPRRACASPKHGRARRTSDVSRYSSRRVPTSRGRTRWARCSPCGFRRRVLLVVVTKMRSDLFYRLCLFFSARRAHAPTRSPATVSRPPARPPPAYRCAVSAAPSPARRRRAPPPTPTRPPILSIQQLRPKAFLPEPQSRHPPEPNALFAHLLLLPSSSSSSSASSSPACASSRPLRSPPPPPPPPRVCNLPHSPPSRPPPPR